MIRLTCECCGSNELERQKDGFYKCCFCGSKYSIDKNDIIENKKITETEILNLYFKAEDFRLKEKYNSEIEILIEALTLNENNALTWSKLGRAYRVQGFVDKAIDCYYKAMTIDPDYAQSYTNIGTAYIIKKNYAEAVKFFKKGLALLDTNNIDYATILANYGIAVALNGNKIKGAFLIKKAEILGYTYGDNARRMIGLGILNLLP